METLFAICIGGCFVVPIIALSSLLWWFTLEKALAANDIDLPVSTQTIDTSTGIMPAANTAVSIIVRHGFNLKDCKAYMNDNTRQKYVREAAGYGSLDYFMFRGIPITIDSEMAPGEVIIVTESDENFVLKLKEIK